MGVGSERLLAPCCRFGKGLIDSPVPLSIAFFPKGVRLAWGGNSGSRWEKENV